VYGIDRKAPLDLFEARNAVRIARAAKAEQYAPSSFAKAEQDLKQAEDYYRRKQGRTPIGTVAREAVQTAEEARVMSLKRQEEERVEKEKQAAAAREAQANAEAEAQTQRRMQAETERASAEQAKAEAERAKQESDVAAKKLPRRSRKHKRPKPPKPQLSLNRQIVLALRPTISSQKNGRLRCATTWRSKAFLSLRL